MNLKCMINGTEYTDVIVQGATFSEEYNETLDSGSIILSHVEKIENLLPYDDVFIYNVNVNYASNNKVYFHLLVNNFTYERVNLSPYKDDNKIYYTYKIELFSETKGLETVQLPNISITQPKNFGNKKTKNVFYYLNYFIEMYSPKIKVMSDNNTWVYQNKYKLTTDQEFKKIFSNVYAPSFSLNNPNLRDVLSQLMLVKDIIPIVKDGVISGLDITKRNKKFDDKGILNVTGSRTSENHCDALKRTYNNALSEENTCKNVEYLGFRNSSAALMTLDNMKLETRFPIYKINKIYACYYKKIKVIEQQSSVYYDKIFLCKQDITPLVKLNAERQILSKDWNDLKNDNPPKNIKELSEYRMATIGYDIGSRYITGWGEKFEYIVNDITWFPRTNTYLQNVMTLVDAYTPLGIRDEDYFRKNGQLSDNEFISPAVGYFLDVYVNPFDGYNFTVDKVERNNKDIVGLKGIFFEIEYEGFYNGTVIHSKDNAYENIVMNDNSSSSLTLLEKDGLFQKEKVNRFGNEAITIRARYDDINDLQPLGSVFEDDIIIYHREYSIYDNFILATYYGTKDYVLKNYFTTVFSKHRPFNLLSYEESVRRSENKKMYLFLDKENLYYEENKNNFIDSNLDISKILSFFKYNHNIIDDEKNNRKLFLTYPDKINYGYIQINDKKYASDINVFVCGDSLCFNMAMYDNVSGGVYIKEKEPDISNIITDDVKKDYTGSLQDWYMTVDDIETGFLERAGFYFSHVDNTFVFYEQELIYDDTDDTNKKSETINNVYEKLFKLPQIVRGENDYSLETNIIGADYNINKDNKELIDITYQIEPISFNKNVFFSPWMMKLSHLNSTYKTYIEEKSLDSSTGFNFNVFYTTLTESYTNTYNQGPLIILMIDKNDVEKLKINQILRFTCKYNETILKGQDGRTGSGGTLDYASNIEESIFNFDFVENIKNNTIILRGSKTEIGKNTLYYNRPFNMIFKEVTHLYDPDMEEVPGYPSTYKHFKLSEHVSQGDNYRFFTNMVIRNTEASGVDDLSIFQEVDFFGNDFFKLKDFKAATYEQVTSLNIFNDNSNISLNSGYFNHINNVKAEPIVTKINYLPAIKVYYSDNEIKKHLIYDEYESLGFLIEEKKSIEEIISINEIKEKYITIQLQNVRPSIKSVQVWFYDNGSYKFVFGVNLTDDDIANGYVKIYISAISNKDPRVYKSTRGILDGYVQNLLEPDAPKYGTGQYYKKIKKQ